MNQRAPLGCERHLPSGAAFLVVLALAASSFAGSLNDVSENASGVTIGTRPDSKLALWSATPVVQPAQTLTTRAALQSFGGLADDSANTASASAGAATLSKVRGIITSEALTTAAGAAYTLTVTNTLASASSIIVGSVSNGTNTVAGLELGTITPGASSFVVLVWNRHTDAALNGTVKFSYSIQ